jgi:CheY-like chemotaxis protein
MWSIDVLVVEDDAADSNLILGALKRHPKVASAHAADTPHLALRQLAAGAMKPDLVLLDIHMPRLDGFEFLDALRKVPAMAQVPVVFVTTSARAMDVVSAKLSSASLYVVKPDSFIELQTRLDGVIKRLFSFV